MQADARQGLAERLGEPEVEARVVDEQRPADGFLRRHREDFAEQPLEPGQMAQHQCQCRQGSKYQIYLLYRLLIEY